MPRVAIIGAGLSGSVLAGRLSQAGIVADVFEKSRGAGGRLSTRRTDSGRVNHGAGFVHAHDPGFRDFLARQEGMLCLEPESVRIRSGFGVVSQGEGRQTSRFCHPEGMNHLCRNLLVNSSLKTESKVTSVKKKLLRGIELYSSEVSLGFYDWVVTTCPPAQAAEILGGVASFSRAIASQEFLPAWVLVTFPKKEDLPGWDFAEVDDSPIYQIEIQKFADSVALKATAAVDFSRKYLDSEPEAIESELRLALEAILGRKIEESGFCHRWRYARPATRNEEGFYRDGRVLAIGDWCRNGSSEDAFLSANQAADHMLKKMGRLF